MRQGNKAGQCDEVGKGNGTRQGEQTRGEWVASCEKLFVCKKYIKILRGLLDIFCMAYNMLHERLVSILFFANYHAYTCRGIQEI